MNLAGKTQTQVLAAPTKAERANTYFCFSVLSERLLVLSRLASRALGLHLSTPVNTCRLHSSVLTASRTTSAQQTIVLLDGQAKAPLRDLSSVNCSQVHLTNSLSLRLERCSCQAFIPNCRGFFYWCLNWTISLKCKNKSWNKQIVFI